MLLITLDDMITGSMICKLVSIIVFTAAFAMGLQVMYTINTEDSGEIDPTTVPTTFIDLGIYELDIKQKTSIIFHVKAKADIAVLATDTYNIHSAKNFYRFYIGGHQNTWCQLAIVRNGVFTEQKVFGAYADALNSKPFWFSWENGVLRAGQGNTIGQQTLITSSDSIPISVNGIGIGTSWRVTGEWKITVDDKFAGDFSNCEVSNTRSDLPIIANYSTTEISCAGKCTAEKTCIGFNYQLRMNRCELLSYGDEPVTSIMRRNLEGWNFYTKCYDGKRVCVGCFF